MNTHLNAFYGYDRNQDHFENQLTRGLMILLRLSPAVFQSFYEYLRDAANGIPVNSQIYSCPSSYTIDLSKREIGFQTSNIDPKAAKLLSILITNEIPDDQDVEIEEARRGRIYDAVLTMPEEFIAIIENKLNVAYIDPEQYNPDLSVIEESKRAEIEHLRRPIHLKWSDIIKLLTNLYVNQEVSLAETYLIQDYLTLINDKFSYLNPYDKFVLCRDNSELIGQRLSSILKKVVKSSSTPTYEVGYHRSWAYKIGINRKDIGINQIDFPIYNPDTPNWSIAISLQFGVTLEQIRNFYKPHIPYENIQRLTDESKWVYAPIIHIGHMYESRVHIESHNLGNPEHFYRYWQENIDSLWQLNPASLIIDKINDLVDDGIIIDAAPVIEELNQRYLNNPNITKLNLRPTIALERRFSNDYLVKHDDGKDRIAREFLTEINKAMQNIVGIEI